MSATPTSNDHPLIEDAKQRVDNTAIDSAAIQNRRTQQTRDAPQSVLLENEKLRREIAELRRQLSLPTHPEPTYRIPLRPVASDSDSSHTRRKKVGSKSKRTSSNGDVMLELPVKLYSDPLSSNNSKDHQSVSTTDERETVEPPIDIESHQSAVGLHHRLSRHLSISPTTNIEPGKMPPHQARKTTTTTELVMDDDEDISDSKGDLDEDDSLADLIGNDSLETKDPNNKRHNDGIVIDESNPNPHRQSTFFQSLADRAGWLIGLLIFQSLSSFILARNEPLLKKNPVIVQFLTMLVGAGGNAGNQASVGVVRGIAVGTVNRSNLKRVLLREFSMGVALSLILGLAGFARAKAFLVPWAETFAITTSLFMIVIISVIVGASLPMGMHAVGIDPAHSSTTIQVIMDITGVVITVNVSSFMLGALSSDR